MKNGFTFVETLITIIIISLILAISFGSLVPLVQKIGRDSKLETFEANLKQMFVSVRAASLKDKISLGLDYTVYDSGEASIVFSPSKGQGRKIELTADGIDAFYVTPAATKSYSYTFGFFTSTDTLSNDYKIENRVNFKIEFENGLESTMTVLNGLLVND